MLTQKAHDKFGVLIIATTTIVATAIGVLYFKDDKPKKDTGFHMYKYNVEPACINHIQYYAVGNTDGLKAITPAFTKDGKVIECNFGGTK